MMRPAYGKFQLHLHYGAYQDSQTENPSIAEGVDEGDKRLHTAWHVRVKHSGCHQPSLHPQKRYNAQS